MRSMTDQRDPAAAPSPFQIGDVVQLKSGGKYMTVRNVLEDGAVIASWFDGDVMQTYSFAPVCLRSP